MLFSSSHDVERRHDRLVPFAQSGDGDHTAQQFAGPDPSLLAELNLQAGTRTRMDILPGYDQGGSALPGSMSQAKPGGERDTTADPVRCAGRSMITTPNPPARIRRSAAFSACSTLPPHRTHRTYANWMPTAAADWGSNVSCTSTRA